MHLHRSSIFIRKFSLDYSSESEVPPLTGALFIGAPPANNEVWEGADEEAGAVAGREDGLRAGAAFFAADFLGADFFAAAFLGADFFAAAFLGADFFAAAFLGADFLAAFFGAFLAAFFATFFADFLAAFLGDFFAAFFAFFAIA
jgi:uncharacterized protein YjbI with pentapeptide repeats